MDFPPREKQYVLDKKPSVKFAGCGASSFLDACKNIESRADSPVVGIRSSARSGEDWEGGGLEGIQMSREDAALVA